MADVVESVDNVVNVEFATHIESGRTLEEMAIKLNQRMTELLGRSMHIVSVSHAVDPTSDEYRYTALIVAHSVEAKPYV